MLERVKQEFEFDGSKPLKLEKLEIQALVPYSNTIPIADFIDQFQNNMAELDSISPTIWHDDRKKRQLLSNIRMAAGVAHLIQTCRDNVSMTFDKCASYIR